MLHSIPDVQAAIASGRPLILAGTAESLRQLPRGNWIAGTIPYFMDGVGLCAEDRIFVTELPPSATGATVAVYSAARLPAICLDAQPNGFSVLIVPCGSAAHAVYAENAPSYEEMFLRPVVGWVSGVHLSRIGLDRPQVFDGRTATAYPDAAVVMHVGLPPGKLAEVAIVNVFAPGAGDTISFETAGFSATACLIDGRPANLAHYMASAAIDARLPLTASYGGSVVNVSVQQVDAAAGRVDFYAPVFPGVEYRFAAPVDNIVEAFETSGAGRTPPDFACNCVLNYVHGDLEGRRLGRLSGPFTFGEIAHQLLNQTYVELRVRDAAA
jgi:hypothetical protein